MILFQHEDKKVLSLLHELKKLNVEGSGVKVKHPILTPVFILRRLIGGNRFKVYVFRYIGDSNNLILAILRYLSDYLIILISKIFKIQIWFLCHNVDKETTMYFPRLINFRRNLIAKNSELILTTNKLLIPKANNVFPDKTIDSISLGYVDDGVLNLDENPEIEHQILKWIDQRKNDHSKFVFCIGAPAKKSLHFSLISEFIKGINLVSKQNWYAIVIGKKVVDNDHIYNCPSKCVLSKGFIKNNADFYYRVIDDFSMSYSTYEAVKYRIPTITENYGILPKLLDCYKIGVVVDSCSCDFKQLINYEFDSVQYESFELENNWEVSAEKIKKYLFN